MQLRRNDLHIGIPAMFNIPVDNNVTFVKFEDSWRQCLNNIIFFQNRCL